MTARGRAAVTLTVVAVVGLIAAWTGPSPIGTTSAARSDIAMYRAVIARLRAGEPYHSTIGSELRARGYASREVFNWRHPLHLTAVAAVSDAVARAVLIALAAAVGIAALAVTRSAGPRVWLPTAVLFSGIIAFSAAPDLVVMSETWAGLLIGASIAAFAFSCTPLGLALALLALFMRELAAPFCVACTVVAIVRRRWNETAAWVAGATVYSLYYGWHLSQVWPLRRVDDIAHATSWLEGGGLPFVLATFEWSGWLFMLPASWNTAALMLLAGGIVSRRCPRHVMAAAVAYVLWFAVAGKPFDHYWGLVAAPAWALACSYGVDGIGRRRAR